MKKNSVKLLIAALLILSLSLVSLADTIRLKDGSVIRGKVVGFRDQQFTVLVGTSARGRQSSLTLYLEDVESIEFDGAAAGAAASTTSAGDESGPPATQTARSAPSQSDATQTDTTSSTARPPSRQPASSSSQTSPTFFQVNTRVRSDSTTNGWTNSGLVVRRGQRLRINATGRVTLGAGRISTPGGITTLIDRDKLMRAEPTGALIAVIGDDNDDFIMVGRSRDFSATRDGVLFLGVNEGNLGDNSGAYDVVIEAEAVGGTTR